MVERVCFYVATTTRISRYAQSSPSAQIDRDMNSPSGFITALLFTLAVETGGLVWLGTVCSSWIFLSRGSTGTA